MSDRRKFILSLPAVPLLVSGCKIKTINYFPPHPANVRVLNVLPQAPAVNVTVNGIAAFNNVAYPTATAYQNYDNERTGFAIFSAGATTSMLQFDYLLAGEQTYTLAVMGTTANPSGGMLQEVPQAPTGGQFQLATFNASIAYANSTLDIYVNPPATDIATVGANYNVGYNATTRNLAMNGGPYRVVATLQGTKTIVYDSGAVPIAGDIATVFLCYSVGSNFLVNAGFLQSGGNWTISDNVLSRIKVVNAAPSVGPVNLLLGGSAVVSNLAYAAASNFSSDATITATYVVVAAGSSALSFEASSTPGATIAGVTATLKPGADQTVFVTGLPGANQAIVLSDMNLAPFPGNARLRFVNTSPDAGPMNVLIDGTVQVSGLAPNTASAYLEVAQATYTVTFVNASTGATLLALPVVPIQNGTMSVFAIGLAASMTGLATQDA